MKKISLLFVTLLVLVSGIVFSGCGNKYKKLNISLSGIYYSSDTYYAEDGVIQLPYDLTYENRIVITDNGIGIASDNVEKTFKTFSD